MPRVVGNGSKTKRFYSPFSGFLHLYIPRVIKSSLCGVKECLLSGFMWCFSPGMQDNHIYLRAE